MRDEQTNKRVGTCPLEQSIAAALDRAGIAYLTDYEGKNPTHLDFYLPAYQLHIEVKGGHTSRIGEQMSRASNVICLQGVRSVSFFIKLLKNL